MILRYQHLCQPGASNLSLKIGIKIDIRIFGRSLWHFISFNYDCGSDYQDTVNLDLDDIEKETSSWERGTIRGELKFRSSLLCCETFFSLGGQTHCALQDQIQLKTEKDDCDELLVYVVYCCVSYCC